MMSCSLNGAARWPAKRSARAGFVGVKSGVMVGLLALLSACGGGGGDSPAASSSGSTAAASSTGTCNLADFQQQVLDRVNALRATGGSCGASGNFAASKPLTWNGLLAKASDGHAADMATQNYFAHTSLDGRTLGTRVTAAGYSWQLVGENIAAGYSSVESVMAGWRASDGHCANLLNPAYTEIGVACVAAPSTSQYGNYWVMDLGTAR